MRYSFVFLLLLSASIFSCKSSQSTTTNSAPPSENRSGPSDRQGPPNLDQLFARMDANQDGQLSKSEVKGPLADQFSKIDTNEDGLLSRQEMEKAPRPSRGPR